MAMILWGLGGGSSFNLHHADAAIRSPTSLDAGSDRWWDGDNSNNAISDFFGGSKVNGQNQEQSSFEPQQQKQQPLITREMEDEVLASARSTLDSNTVSRAISSLLVDNKSDTNINGSGGEWSGPANKNYVSGKSSLRDLASSTMDDNSIGSRGKKENQIISSNRDSSTSWDTQQIAIASGATTFFLSPLVIPIIHSLLPPIIPSPSSLSFTGAALLGTISYIVALGDPTDQTNEGVEVGGAVSRIVGRSALQTTKVAAPRLKAAARAMVDYDSTTATLEELQRVQQELSQTVLELEDENDNLRNEVALWQAVEDVSSMYKLEELKEMARYEGVKGYSTDSKNALLRRLVKEGILKLDLTPYYT